MGFRGTACLETPWNQGTPPAMLSSVEQHPGGEARYHILHSNPEGGGGGGQEYGLTSPVYDPQIMMGQIPQRWRGPKLAKNEPLRPCLPELIDHCLNGYVKEARKASLPTEATSCASWPQCCQALAAEHLVRLGIAAALGDIPKPI